MSTFQLYVEGEGLLKLLHKTEVDTCGGVYKNSTYKEFYVFVLKIKEMPQCIFKQPLWKCSLKKEAEQIPTRLVHFTFSKTSDEKDEMLANLNTRVRLFSFLLLMLLRKLKLANAIPTRGSSPSHRNIKAVQDKVDEVRSISKNHHGKLYSH